MSRLQLYIKAPLLIALLAAALSGCRAPGPTPAPGGSPPAQTQTSTPPEGAAAPTDTPIPTATAIPIAARANGFEITQAEFEAELKQLQAAAGRDASVEDRTRVMNALVDEALLAAAAIENGFAFGPAELDQRLQALADQAGGETALAEWIQTNGHTPESFAAALRRAAAAAWMRDQITAAVPQTAEQVHARQILLYTAEEAANVYAQLRAGNDFGNLAVKYDPATRGDLGWFPHGFLTDPKLDEAVFGLQPEAYSEIIQTPAGYHILQLLEREAERPLSPEALLQAQVQAVHNWLSEHRGSGTIEILLP